MNWIYPTQLFSILTKQIKSIYILFGNDLYLLQNIQINILKKINALYHTEKLKIELNINLNWDEIFNFCKTINLFTQKKILLLNCPKNYPIYDFEEKISLLFSMIHKNLILILLVYTSFLPKKCLTWIKNQHDTAILINCIVPEHKLLETWIKNQAFFMQLKIENLVCQLLCYYYEGNYILLKQILQNLFLIYPDGKITFERAKNIIFDSAFFSDNHWIESILIGKKQRANRILQHLDSINFNWKNLLYKIQNETLTIIQIKYQIIQGKLLPILFKQYQIYTQHHQFILSKAIQKFTLNQLYIIVSLLVHMELKYHNNFMRLNKSDFEILTEIFCNIDSINSIKKFFQV